MQNFSNEGGYLKTEVSKIEQILNPLQKKPSSERENPWTWYEKISNDNNDKKGDMAPSITPPLWFFGWDKKSTKMVWLTACTFWQWVLFSEISKAKGVSYRAVPCDVTYHVGGVNTPPPS